MDTYPETLVAAPPEQVPASVERGSQVIHCVLRIEVRGAWSERCTLERPARFRVLPTRVSGAWPGRELPVLAVTCDVWLGLIRLDLAAVSDPARDLAELAGEAGDDWKLVGAEAERWETAPPSENGTAPF